MNLAEWEVPIPAICVVVGLAFRIVAMALLVEITLFLWEPFLFTFLKSFENQSRVYILGYNQNTLLGFRVLGHMTKTIC